MADDISMFECWRNIYDVRYEGEHVVSINIFCRYIFNQVNGVISCFRLPNCIGLSIEQFSNIIAV